jgi:hypothetical protein
MKLQKMCLQSVITLTQFTNKFVVILLDQQLEGSLTVLLTVVLFRAAIHSLLFQMSAKAVSCTILFLCTTVMPV